MLWNQAVRFAILGAFVWGCGSADGQEVSARLRFDASQDDGDVARRIRESGSPGDFVETRYVDETPMPGLRVQDRQRGYVVFRRHWMDLVFPNSIPKRREIAEKVGAFASRGEYEPVTFCVTLNRPERIAPASILRRIVYHHPVFTSKSIQAQSRWKEINGTNQTWFCGAYWGYGFHEDGVNSALNLCRQFGKDL